MSKAFIVTLFVLAGYSGTAQNIPGAYINNFSNQFSEGLFRDTFPGKKWSINSYKAVSTGFTAFKGGHATFFSVPIGLQVTRQINNNVFAFGRVSVAPAYINFNRSFFNTDFSKGASNNFFRTNRAAIYSRAELGIGFTNDERTFQVSGSIGISRDNNSYYQPPLIWDGRHNWKQQ